MPLCACGCRGHVPTARYPSKQRRYIHNHHWRGVRRSVEYDWSNLATDLDRYGSTVAVAEAVGVSQAEVHRRAVGLGYSVTRLRGASGVGRHGELIALDLLEGSEDMLHRGHEPYDLRWKGQRINVKTSRANARGWSFNTSRGRDHCDAFCCIGLVRDDPMKVWLIPSDTAPRGLRISTASTRWDEYRML